jgi:hypothetical protein
VIRQQRHGVDRFGLGEQPRRPWPVPRPFRAGLRCERGDVSHCALRNVACHRSRAIEVLFADPVGEKVDQPGDVGLRLVDEAGRRLLRRQRLGHGRCEGHDLDAEVGSMISILSQSRRAMDARDGRWLEAAGLVLVRQRPGSAKGVMFITLEDETGIANLVVWPQVFEKFRPVVTFFESVLNVSMNARWRSVSTGP